MTLLNRILVQELKVSCDHLSLKKKVTVRRRFHATTAATTALLLNGILLKQLRHFLEVQTYPKVTFSQL